MASNKPSMADQEDSRAGRPSTGGFIAVKNLQLPHGVVAPNVWGKLKEQPVLATVNLHLSQGFTSAASKDALDQSTIHYGDLAKRIRASSVADQGILDLLSAVEGAVCAMSIREDGSSKIVTSETELTLPKASMLGEKVTMSKIQQYDATGKATSTRLLFMAEKMKVMALIGVNDYERKARQPVIATLRLSIDYEAVEAAKLAGVLVLEHKIANIIQDSSFETLEALAHLTLRQVQNELQSQGLHCNELQIRFEKPKAIAFADAAVVEVLQVGRDTQSAGISETDQASEPRTLNVIKPYV